MLTSEVTHGLDLAILVEGIVSHVDVSLTDSLTLSTTEMDGLIVGILLHELDDRDTVNGEEVLVCSIQTTLSAGELA